MQRVVRSSLLIMGFTAVMALLQIEAFERRSAVLDITIFSLLAWC
jgi:hypothetical protein